MRRSSEGSPRSPHRHRRDVAAGHRPRREGGFAGRGFERASPGRTTTPTPPARTCRHHRRFPSTQRDESHGPPRKNAHHRSRRRRAIVSGIAGRDRDRGHEPARRDDVPRADVSGPGSGVMGMAGVLDSARLGISSPRSSARSPVSVEAMTLGSHGESNGAAASTRDRRRETAHRARRRNDARALYRRTRDGGARSWRC